MQKNFFIINNDRLLNDLIEQQVSIVFKKYFDIKFLKTHDVKGLNEFDKMDLIIVNFNFIRDNYNLLTYLEDKKKIKGYNYI